VPADEHDDGDQFAVTVTQAVNSVLFIVVVPGWLSTRAWSSRLAVALVLVRRFARLQRA
jgi:hypothetical protein